MQFADRTNLRYSAHQGSLQWTYPDQGLRQHYKSHFNKCALIPCRSGRGEEKAHFKDLNMGEPFTRYVSAKLYYSWFAPNGPASFAKNAENLKPGTPLLYIVASKQKKIAISKNPAFAFEKAPPHPNSKFVTISSDHLHTPGDSLEVVTDWLRTLK